MCFLKTSVTAPVYREILEHFMHSSTDQLFKDADFIFQQGLAPAHTATSTKRWLNEHGVGVLDWPANSPDLNLREQGFSKFTFKCPNLNYHQNQKVRNNCYYKTCFFINMLITLYNNSTWYMLNYHIYDVIRSYLRNHGFIQIKPKKWNLVTILKPW